MLFIKKGAEPIVLRNAKRELRATQGVVYNYDNLRIDKSKLIEALLAEQGYICAYCMRALRKPDKAHVEHIDPRHGLTGANDTASVDYRNMLAVCDGDADAGAKHQICDKSKGNQEITISPLDERLMIHIGYRRSAKQRGILLVTYSSENADFDERARHDLDEVLNLNDSQTFVPKGRWEVMDSTNSYLSKILGSLKSREARRRALKKAIEAIRHQAEKPQYAGVVLWCFEKALKKYD